jgi:hypothetical protein
MANNLGVVFKGFDKEIAKYTKALNGGIKPIIEKTLKVAPKTINPLISRDIKLHHRTGKTERSMERQNKVTWSGTEATIPVGFHIRRGGLPSIFLMYGTARHYPGDTGPYHTKPDVELREDIIGPNIEKKIANEQEDIFHKEITKAFGG